MAPKTCWQLKCTIPSVGCREVVNSRESECQTMGIWGTKKTNKIRLGKTCDNWFGWMIFIKCNNRYNEKKKLNETAKALGFYF